MAEAGGNRTGARRGNSGNHGTLGQDSGLSGAIHARPGISERQRNVRALALALAVVALAAPGWAQPTTVDVSAQESIPDALGRRTVQLLFPDMPVMGVKYGDTWEATYRYRLPGDVTIRKVRSFAGVDRGHVWEGHVLVLVEDYYIATRSPHKEAVSGYDAWTSERADYRVPPEGADLYVYALARPTLKKAVNYELGVIIELVP
jgi:hypothetical protein